MYWNEGLDRINMTLRSRYMAVRNETTISDIEFLSNHAVMSKATDVKVRYNVEGL